MMPGMDERFGGERPAQRPLRSGPLDPAVTSGLLAPEVRFERAAKPAALLPQPIANRSELRTRCVDDFTRGRYLPTHFRNLTFERRARLDEGGERRKPRCLTSNRDSRVVDGFQKIGEPDKTRRFQRPALNREGQKNGFDFRRRRQRERAIRLQVLDRFRRVTEDLRDALSIGQGMEGTKSRHPQRRNRKALCNLDDAIEFEGAQTPVCIGWLIPGENGVSTPPGLRRWQRHPYSNTRRRPATPTTAPNVAAAPSASRLVPTSD